MASFIAKKVSHTLFANQAASMEPADPHYETYQDERGRTKSRKRKMPVGLTKKDERILRSVRRRAHYLDKGFSLCGFRFGWTAILGLIPLAGDIAAFLLGYCLVLRKCRQADLPFALSQRMAFNQAVSVGIGLVPLVGDLMLAIWKANSRNAALLEDFLIKRAAQHLQGNVASEEQAAQATLAQSHISPLSGERISGPPPYVISEDVANEDREVTGAKAKPAGQGRFYGWGKGKKSMGEEVAHLPAVAVTGTATTATTATTAGPLAGGSKLKKAAP